MAFSEKNTNKNKPLFTAADFLERKNISFKIPPNLILLPAVNFTRELSGLTKKTYNLVGNIEIINDNLGIMHNFDLGAPLCVFLAEIASVLGVKRFILAGLAGALADNLTFGERILCTGAFADEGTSRHYLEEEYFESSLDLDLLSLGFKACGPVWTTDAVFMETISAIEHYLLKGCLAVDMEASALFAFAKARGLKAGAAFIIGDLLYSGKWQTPAKSAHSRKALLNLVLEIIQSF